MKEKSNAIDSATLLIHCPDMRGVVSSVTEFIFKNKGNILYLDQHVDPVKDLFFMRVEWDLTGFSIPREKIGESFGSLIGERFNMQWKLHFSGEVPRMAVFVSKLPHCLYDILARCKSGELKVDIPLIISNHIHLKVIADQFRMNFHHSEITPQNKRSQEKIQLALMREHKINFIVLARYMQILTKDFVDQYPNRIINIHHSFLPAFPGAKPYHSAHDRGVKVIGATSHYVTSELDSGPIIEQDVTRVSHTDSVEDLIRKGRDLEKVVLSRAIWSHVERKTLVYDNRTVIFT
ncbi:MAG: formyltetrahydrofolate deformylase [Nitrospira sp.]|nr:formyltetrahydrofolate deformylase [Candidatus Manganitrophaceae bacterium]HIL35699.1 formyltetrahydrofolate deformylase [Candidatus Manganitrophaceae bacterium]